MNKTSLLYWWPKVKDLGIPVPRTEIWDMGDGLKSWFYAMEGRRLSSDLFFVEEAEQVARLIGYPLFLRTDLASGKHDWKRTCYVEDESVLPDRIYRLLDANERAGIVGLDYRALVFRQMLTLFAPFVAFRGDLPIARERRYFIRHGKLECHHPYWIEEAVAGGRPEAEGWRETLAMLNTEHETEIAVLTSYSEKVAEVMGEYWSIDYAFALDGTWWLIDMAEGEKSWHPGCLRTGTANREEGLLYRPRRRRKKGG